MKSYAVVATNGNSTAIIRHITKNGESMIKYPVIDGKTIKTGHLHIEAVSGFFMYVATFNYVPSSDPIKVTFREVNYSSEVKGSGEYKIAK